MYARAVDTSRAQLRMSPTSILVLVCLSMDISRVAANLFHFESISWVKEMKVYGPLTGQKGIRLISIWLHLDQQRKASQYNTT